MSTKLTKFFVVALALSVVVLVLGAVANRMPILRGYLQSALDGNGYSITNADRVEAAHFKGSGAELTDVTSASTSAIDVAAGTNLSVVTNSSTLRTLSADVSHAEVVAASNIVQAYSIAVSNLTFVASNTLWQAGIDATNVPWLKGTNGLSSAAWTSASAYDPAGAATAVTNTYPWGTLYDAAGTAQTSTNSITSSWLQGKIGAGVYDPAGAAAAVTNGYPWGPIYQSALGFTPLTSSQTTQAVQQIMTTGTVAQASHATNADNATTATSASWLSGPTTNLIAYGNNGIGAAASGNVALSVTNSAGQTNVFSVGTTNSAYSLVVAANGNVGIGGYVDGSSDVGLYVHNKQFLMDDGYAIQTKYSGANRSLLYNNAGNSRFAGIGLQYLQLNSDGFSQFNMVSGKDFEIRNHSDVGVFRIQESTGNVGIGTTSPQAKEHIYSTTTPAFQISGALQTNLFTVSTNGNATLSGTITATNGVVLVQLAAIPTNSILPSTSTYTNWTLCNILGTPFMIATNYAAAGSFLKIAPAAVTTWP